MTEHADRRGGGSAFMSILILIGVVVAVYVFQPDLIEAAGDLVGAALGLAIGLVAATIAIVVGIGAGLLASVIGVIAVAAALIFGGAAFLAVALVFLSPFLIILALLMLFARRRD